MRTNTSSRCQRKFDQLRRSTRRRLISPANSGPNAPGAVEETIRQAHRSILDWRSLLRRYMTDAARRDYSWSVPNRRFIDSGLYLPSMHSEGIDAIAITSRPCSTRPTQVEGTGHVIEPCSTWPRAMLHLASSHAPPGLEPCSTWPRAMLAAKAAIGRYFSFVFVFIGEERPDRTPPGPPAPSIAHVANADRQQQAACQSETILARFPAWIGSNMGNPR